MHCKHCGNKIESDSVFCSFCGNKVNKIEELIPTQNDKSIQKDKINISNLFLVIYLVWFLIHLVILLTHWKTELYDFHYERFWPFSEDSKIRSYDYTEFLLYVIIPIILLLIFRLFKRK